MFFFCTAVTCFSCVDGTDFLDVLYIAINTKYPSELAESERVELEDMIKELTERGEIHCFQICDYV